MENATKALLMAGGVLIAIIIISVIVITLQKTGNVNKTYDSTIKQEEITKFNVNFTKYVGKELTIQQVVTICNFARENNVSIVSGEKFQKDISDDIENIKVEDGKRKQKAYRIYIDSDYYDFNTGLINKIRFENNGWIEK